MKKKDFKIYNIILPIWFLLWFPTPLWLIVIPANYILDFLVLWLSIRKEDNGKAIAWQNSVKVCMAGFLSDFVGVALLFSAYIGLESIESLRKFNEALIFNPFRHIGAASLIIVSIVLSGICIYKLDKRILRKNSALSEELIHKTALRLAVFTAPYFYILPVEWFYNG